MPPTKQFPIVREVSLTREQDRKLSRHAALLGVSVASVIRAAVDARTQDWVEQEVRHAN